MRTCVEVFVGEDASSLCSKVAGAMQVIGLVLMLGWGLVSAGAAERAGVAGSVAQAGYAKLPLSFEANAGQMDGRVRFVARGGAYSLFLTETGAVLDLQKKVAGDGDVENHDLVRMELVGAAKSSEVSGVEKLPGVANYFVGKDASQWRSGVATYSRVRYGRVYPGVDLVYYGNQRQLEYDFVVAPGADAGLVRLRFAGSEKLIVDAAGDLRVRARDGEIAFQKPVVYQTRRGGKAGEREPVAGRFVLLAGDEVGFRLGRYDHARELVIDPTLVYSTFLGGEGSELGGLYPIGDTVNAIAVDGSGNAYVTGTASSADFPVTTGAYQTKKKAVYSNAFVSKINATGTALIYSTYLGGTGENNGVTGSSPAFRGDSGTGIAVDGSGNAYITGDTFSADFPVTAGAFQKVNHATIPAVVEYGDNAFVTELNATGTALVYSTYLGGGAGVEIGGTYTLADSATGIALDGQGRALVTGVTRTTDFPVTSGAFQKTNKSGGGAHEGGSNAFLSVVNVGGGSLAYSTYLGGSGPDAAAGIALDGGGNAYLTGTTFSADFPVTSGAFQTVNGAAAKGGSNAFVARLNPAAAGSASLVFATYVGGSTPVNAVSTRVLDGAAAIAVGGLFGSSVYITGSATSSDFPVTNGISMVNGSEGFVTGLDSMGSYEVLSTFLTGDQGAIHDFEADLPAAIAVDASQSIYVAGASTTTTLPVTSDAYQFTNKGALAYPGQGVPNGFLVKLANGGDFVGYATYFGGSGLKNYSAPLGDAVSGLALDGAGGIYLAGTASSSNFPVTGNALQKKQNGVVNESSDGFVAKFGAPSTAPTTATSLAANVNPQRAGYDVRFTISVISTQYSTIPTGFVALNVDGGPNITLRLNSEGLASYGASFTAGTHTVTATYLGNGPNYTSSTSNTVSEVITGPAATVTPLNGSGLTLTYGAVIGGFISAQVKDANGVPIPNVVVSFSGDGVRFNRTTAAADSNGSVQVEVFPTRAGAVTATASVGSASGVFKLTALKAQLAVTPVSVTVPYGKAIPALTYKLTGLVNGDKSTVVTGAPTETTTAKAGSKAGKYPITLGMGSLAAANYTFVLGSGTVTVTGQ